MLPLAFLRANGRLIAFGVFMCFCSSFGQTFFISLFGGEIRGAFGLSHGAFGSIYAAGTLTSAAVLVWLGGLIDRTPLAVFAAAVLAGLAATCLLMGAVWSAGALTLAIFGLRLFGQGLASHTAITAMGRYFDAERGRAVSVASLGHPLGEALFPILVVAAFAVMSWRSVWTGAGLALVALLPLIFPLLKGHGARDHALKARRAAAGGGGLRDLALGEALRDPGLWLRLPALLAPSFIFTGLIFHQVHLAEAKGWPLSLIAGSFTAYAVGSVATMIAAGPLIDRLTARRLVPVFLAPLAAACLALYASDAALVAPLFLALLGVSAGMTQVLKGALWAELYGTTHLGAIRAFGQAAMVFSSGVAPAVMGLAFDLGVTVAAIAATAALYCLAASAFSTLAQPPRRVAAETR